MRELEAAAVEEWRMAGATFTPRPRAGAKAGGGKERSGGKKGRGSGRAR